MKKVSIVVFLIIVSLFVVTTAIAIAAAPAAPSNLFSTSHTTGLESSNNTITMIWTMAIDTDGDLNGYATLWDNVSDTVPWTKTLDALAISAQSPALSDADNWYFHIRAIDDKGNYSDTLHVGPFIIKTAPSPPTPPTNLLSTSHTTGVSSTNNIINLIWTASTDTNGDLNGYATLWNNTSDTVPWTKTFDASVTSASSQPLDDATDWYFHIRAIDDQGNYSNTVHLGPFVIVTSPGPSEPNITVSSESYHFGSVNIGDVSGIQEVTISNTGGANLLIGSLGITGTNFSEFNLQNDNCSGKTLSASESCIVSVSFSPNFEGSKSATLSIPSNDPDTPVSDISLTGKGIQNLLKDGSFEAGSPNPYWNDVSESYGNSIYQDEEYAHSGEWMAWFVGGDDYYGAETAVLDQNVTIPNANCVILTFWLQILYRDVSANFKVMIDAQEIFVTTEQNSEFHEKWVEVTLDVSNFADGKTHNLKFTADISAGEGSSDLLLDDVTLSIEGELGYPAIQVLPVSHDFGNVAEGNSSTVQTFTVSNTGNTNLLIESFFISGTNANQFAIQNDTCSDQAVAPTGKCTVQALFSPTSAGAKSAALKIVSNDPNTPKLEIPLTGTGLAVGESNISISPISYNFGNIKVGNTSEAKVFTITNLSSDTELLLGILKVSGTDAEQFSLQNDICSDQTIAPMKSCTFESLFSPISEGEKSASIEIRSDDPDTPILDVALAGTGFTPYTVATPKFSPAPGTYSAPQSVTISCATSGATIYYTTDGTKPTYTSSIYSAPIKISKTTTIKARAYKDLTLSTTATGEYQIITVIVEKGDVNGDKKVDLADAILILKILSKIDTGNTVYLNADVNQDGKLGMEDVIYILRMVLAG